MACGCSRDEQAEAQDGIKRGLDPKADPDWYDIPAVEQELAGGIIPALRPGEDAEIDSRNKRGAEQESGEWNEIKFHNNISFSLMIVFMSLRVLRRFAVKTIGIFAYAGSSFLYDFLSHPAFPLLY